MLTNEQMIAGRFANWARYRRAERFIKLHAEAGRKVYLRGNNYLVKYTVITKKNASLVSSSRSGLFVQHGKQRICHMDRSVNCRITAE